MRRRPPLTLCLIALSLGGFSADACGAFRDVAPAAGLVMDPPQGRELDPPPGIDVYVTGGATCAADLDRDGWTDLLLAPTPGRLRVFMNNRDGTFREEGVERGFGEAVDIVGIAAGDLSNRGRTDVFLVPRIGPRYFLYVNDGTGRFTERAVERGADSTVAGAPHQGQSVALVDFDRDGFLDLHVAEWGSKPGTEAARYAVLLRNRGREAPGHFVNVTEQAGLKQPHFGTTNWGFASAWADFDEDGNSDLAYVHDFGVSQLWWNNGNGTFTEGRAAARAATDENGMGVAVADFDRDGRLDYFVSSFDVLSGGTLVSANRLFRNLGGRKFQDVAVAQGVVDSGWGWGAVFLDANNDGLADLLVTNGYSYTARPSATPPANLISDARTDRTRFFQNNGVTFVETGVSWGITDTGYGHGVTVLDYDNDGDEDVVIANLFGPWILYRNDGSGAGSPGGWLRLRFTGTLSNRDGFGTVVRVTTGAVTQTGLYHPTNAFVGQREPFLHFGVGAASTIDRVEVEWPSGAKQTLTAVARNQVLHVTEPGESTHEAPRLTAPPTGGTYQKGAAVVLSAAATGTPAPAFTWYKDGVAIPAWIGPTLPLPHLHPADAGTYRVVASNAAGQASSAEIVIGVTADPHRHTAARWWNETLLDAIRVDTPNPPVHARNLYHLSAALWDAFWAYEAGGGGAAAPLFHRETPPWIADPGARRAAQREAMSHAAAEVITRRFAQSPGAARTQRGITWLMDLLGYARTPTDTSGDSPAAVGSRIGRAVLAATRDDGANDANGYADTTGYVPANEPLVPGRAGITLADPNRWQPLSLAFSVSQNGIVLPSGQQPFVGVNARLTTPFALARLPGGGLALDPGPPPQWGGGGTAQVVAETVEVLRLSALLDPTDPTEVEIPAPSAAGAPLATQLVRGADYARILAEYWADGPDSETPPGHWNVIFNEVSDHPATTFRYGGSGPVLDRLEWEVRGYLALNGAMHDAACAAWTVKRKYDGPRPISLIRYLGSLGQSSDPALPRYHAQGLPLIPNLIELTTAATLAPGGRHAAVDPRRFAVDELVNRLVVRAWQGNPADPVHQVGGVGWMLAEQWVPYQFATFVSPAFPGYVSGHSTFSRAGAEVLTLLTGSATFPGGGAARLFRRGEYLSFEYGPSADVTLYWRTYHEAADQAGRSRLYGGIHFAVDDLAGRRLGARVGLDAFLKAQALRQAAGVRPGLVNVSTRGVSGPGDQVLIAGFVIAEGDTQPVLVRAVGPTLEQFGVNAALCAPDPHLSVYPAGAGAAPLVVNQRWGASPRRAEIAERARQVGAFALPAASLDAAELFETRGGAYSVVAPSGAPGGLPVELVEAYGQRLINVSSRGFVGRGASQLVAGFALVAAEPTPVLVRGIGPALAAFGVSGHLVDPQIQIHRMLPDGRAELVTGNDDWSADLKASLVEVAAASSGAFSLPAGSRDAAVLVQLPAGNYTVTLGGKGDGEGVGLVEVYHVR